MKTSVQGRLGQEAGVLMRGHKAAAGRPEAGVDARVEGWAHLEFRLRKAAGPGVAGSPCQLARSCRVLPGGRLSYYQVFVGTLPALL